ncbi:hypothetical protein D9V32_07330 [Mycetocola tolaasinivorans]|uniref:Uncharacterized protein n=1 Tax=Mycetocola tolaasinivorans TaxID=76635 RepID=A0A3L7A759_9MICO|nr:hypothetical protein [Mycetocola tolaasinivorans]RLP75964.1 hypothetical protein D9V32_07330 [Mycetocola tolaasinivorans]
MMRRAPLLVLAGVFSLLHGILALTHLDRNPSTPPVLIAIALYLGISVLSLALPGGKRLPLVVAVLNVLVSGVVLLLVLPPLDPHAVNGYATWPIAAIGTIMVITLVRGRELTAWVGTGVLIAIAMAWAGPAGAMGIGLPGSVVWMVGASLLSRAMRRLERDNARLMQASRETTLLRAGQDAYRGVRLHRLRQTQLRAAPMLREIVRSAGNLDDEGRAEAVLLEAGLRDEIRGGGLLSDRVRAAALDARRRGVRVDLFDEDGLAGVPAERREQIADVIADALGKLHNGRMVIRTGTGEIAVTIVGIAPDEHGEDELKFRTQVPRVA